MQIDAYENVTTRFTTGPTSIRVVFESTSIDDAREASQKLVDRYRSAWTSRGATKAIRDGIVHHAFVCTFDREAAEIIDGDTESV